MYWLLFLAVCISATASVRSVEYFDLEDAHIHFKDFRNKFNKQYVDEREKEFRFSIFKKNLEDVNRLNKESKHAIYGVTKFMDLTLEEFAARYSCILDPSYDSYTMYCDVIKTDKDIPDAGAPDAFDWRDKKAVTRVKDQGACGSCWAFSSIAVSSEVLHHYTKGIIMDDQCTADIHHGVLLVGYGTENGIPYWIVKNSWGVDIEENGYYRMQRSNNPNGACRMLNAYMATATVD